MANRRMFSLDIIDTDKFLEMPASAQALYFHLGMRADDDGFVSSPKKIAGMSNCSLDDLRLLITKKYLIPFENGVVVITDWLANNYIRGDRKHDTRFIQELSALEIIGNAYQVSTKCLPNDNQTPAECHTEVRLGKVRLEKKDTKVSKEKAKNFIPPTIEEVKAYCIEKSYEVDAERFVNFYEAKGWMIGKNKMKDWKAAVRCWKKQDEKKQSKPSKQHNFEQRNYDMEDLTRQLLNV